MCLSRFDTLVIVPSIRIFWKDHCCCRINYYKYTDLQYSWIRPPLNFMVRLLELVDPYAIIVFQPVNDLLPEIQQRIKWFKDGRYAYPSGAPNLNPVRWFKAFVPFIFVLSFSWFQICRLFWSLTWVFFKIQNYQC